MFKGIDALTLQAIEALKKNDLERLGELMNVCQGLLNGLQVSSWELEELIQIARENGALGAKLTGGGGGGSMIALCPDNADAGHRGDATTPATRRWRSRLAEAAIRPTHEVVSSEEEPLILVDESDREIGHLSKGACHDGDGVLHRAFSLFVFNAAGELLLQQRSDEKRLWPLFWSNSCCSHPRRGETMELATERRLAQELGMTSDSHHLFTFQYQAPYLDLGSENEVCWVYVGSQRRPASTQRSRNRRYPMDHPGRSRSGVRDTARDLHAVVRAWNGRGSGPRSQRYWV